MNVYKFFDDMNKLTAMESVFGANAMAEDGGTGGKCDDWDSAMEKLMAIMLSDKGQIESIIATNATLVELNKTKYIIIAQMTSVNENLVLIITKMAGGKPSTADFTGAMGDGGKNGGAKQKKQTIHHSTQRGIVGRTGSGFTSIIAAPRANGNVVDTSNVQHAITI